MGSATHSPTATAARGFSGRRARRCRVAPSCGELEGFTRGRRSHAMSTNLQRGEFRVLGQDHPLTRATSRLSVAVEQCFTVSGLLAVGVYGLIDGLSIGLPLAVAAATVLIVLLGRVGALIESRKHRAVDLIAEGRGSLPVEAVVRERRRLLDPSDRERMARTLDVIRAEVARPGAACHRVQPLYNVSVVRGVASELGELAILVRRRRRVAWSRPRGAAGHRRPVTAVRRERGGPASGARQNSLPAREPGRRTST